MKDVGVPVVRVYAVADDDVATSMACAIAVAVDPGGSADDETAAAALLRAKGLALVDRLNVSKGADGGCASPRVTVLAQVCFPRCERGWLRRHQWGRWVRRW